MRQIAPPPTRTYKTKLLLTESTSMKGIPVEATFVSLAQHSTVKSPSKLSGGESRGFDEAEKSMLPQLWPPATDEMGEAVPEEVRVAVDDEEPVADAAGKARASKTTHFSSDRRHSRVTTKEPAPVAEAVAVVGAAPHETPAGKSEEYVSPPPPVTTAPEPLASSRRVAGLAAGRKRTVPGMAVSGGVGGVNESPLWRSGSNGSDEQRVEADAPWNSRVEGTAFHNADVGERAPPIPSNVQGRRWRA